MVASVYLTGQYSALRQTHRHYTPYGHSVDAVPFCLALSSDAVSEQSFREQRSYPFHRNVRGTHTGSSAFAVVTVHNTAVDITHRQ